MNFLSATSTARLGHARRFAMEKFNDRENRILSGLPAACSSELRPFATAKRIYEGVCRAQPNSMDFVSKRTDTSVNARP
jgi:hypothetical protein